MISPLYRKTDIACDLGRGDFIHVKEEDHAAKTDESNSDWKYKDRRQLSGCHPVHDKYEDGRCRGYGQPDSRSGKGRMRDHPVCGSDDGGRKGA